MRADVLIAGAGPAGIAAAVRAAGCGKQVIVLDDNLAEGGQIWRGGRRRTADSDAMSWFEKLAGCGAKLLPGSRVISGDPRNRVLQIETSDNAFGIGYNRLILATGARELFLPFPGWTLPNVMGVGGIQALVKGGLPLKGKRVVVAGSGPLLLAVAAYLRKAGATVPAIVEQAGWRQLAPFTMGLTASPAKLRQAAALRISLAATPYWTDSWVTAAEGAGQISRVHIRRPEGARIIECDFLAVSYGFVPNTELADMMGCNIEGGAVVTDGYQRTGSADVLCAGEVTGIGGVDLSLVEGEIAGYAAAGRDDLATKLFSSRQTARRFAGRLDRAFALRDELRQLAEGGTMICRCEDVSFEKLTQASSWRAAKLHFRCGMGPCQGRVCGPAAKFLFGWTPDSVRPPLFPARVSTLISEAVLETSEVSTK